MNGLSALKFIRNNKKQVSVIILAVAVSFLAMYVVYFLINSTQESFKPFMLEAPKHVAYVQLSAKTMGLSSEDYESTEAYAAALSERREEVEELVKAQDGVEAVWYTQLLSASYNGIVGMMGYDFPLLTKEQIPVFLDHMQARLLQGRLPEADGEILVDSVVFQNNHFRIGDAFFEEYYENTFKIVGVIESDGMVCVGMPNGYCNAGWAFVVLCNEESAEMKPLFAKCGIKLTETDVADDIVQFGKVYQEEVVSVIELAMNGLSLVIVIFLSVSILVAYVSFLRGRMEEYCLYRSIGYSQGKVYGMIMREVGLLFGSGIACGIVGAGIGMVLIGKLLIAPLGLKYAYWYPRHLLTIFAAYLLIIGLLQLPILYSLNGVRTVDGMEEQ